jgi:hypothetical protein
MLLRLWVLARRAGAARAGPAVAAWRLRPPVTAGGAAAAWSRRTWVPGPPGGGGLPAGVVGSLAGLAGSRV